MNVGAKGDYSDIAEVSLFRLLDAWELVLTAYNCNNHYAAEGFGKDDNDSMSNLHYAYLQYKGYSKHSS